MGESIEMYKPPSSLNESALSSTPISTPMSSYSENPREAIEKGFVLVPKPKFEVGSYKLFHETVNNKTENVYSAAKEAYANKSYRTCLSFISKALFLDPDNVIYYILGGDAILEYERFQISNLILQKSLYTKT